MQSIPLIDCPCDGFEVSDLQRPTDGHFPVGPGCIARQPSLFGQQHVNSPLTGPALGNQMFPGQTQPMSGISPVSPVAIKVPFNFHPGGPGYSTIQAPEGQARPGQQLRTVDEMLSRCKQVMMQISQQQQHIQQQFQRAFSTAAASATENAMAAAPSPSVHPAQEVEQQQFEVTVATPSYPSPRELAQADEPRMVHRRKTAAACSVNTTLQQIGCRTAESETEAGSARDVTSEGYGHRRLVSVNERPRRRPRNDHKNSFCLQFRPKLANSSTYQWAIAKSLDSSAVFLPPWPPPTFVLFSFELAVFKIGGGRGSARPSSIWRFPLSPRKSGSPQSQPPVSLVFTEPTNRTRVAFNFPRDT